MFELGKTRLPALPEPAHEIHGVEASQEQAGQPFLVFLLHRAAVEDEVC